MGAAEHREVTEKFIAACARGDLDGLLEVLAPDAWGDFDGGPADPLRRGVTHGAVRVARNLLFYWGPSATLVSHPVAGQPALLGFIGRELAGVLVFTMQGGGSQGAVPPEASRATRSRPCTSSPIRASSASCLRSSADPATFGSAAPSLPVPPPRRKAPGRERI